VAEDEEFDELGMLDDDLSDDLEDEEEPGGLISRKSAGGASRADWIRSQAGSPSTRRSGRDLRDWIKGQPLRPAADKDLGPTPTGPSEEGSALERVRSRSERLRQMVASGQAEVEQARKKPTPKQGPLSEVLAGPGTLLLLLLLASGVIILSLVIGFALRGGLLAAKGGAGPSVTSTLPPATVITEGPLPTITLQGIVLPSLPTLPPAEQATTEPAQPTPLPTPIVTLAPEQLVLPPLPCLYQQLPGGCATYCTAGGNNVTECEAARAFVEAQGADFDVFLACVSADSRPAEKTPQVCLQDAWQAVHP
jgi:hypothetical protein